MDLPPFEQHQLDQSFDQIQQTNNRSRLMPDRPRIEIYHDLGLKQPSNVARVHNDLPRHRPVTEMLNKQQMSIQLN